MSLAAILKKVYNQMLPKTSWKFVTSEGDDVSGGPATFSYEKIYIKNGKSSAAKQHVLTYLGAGPGVSVGMPLSYTWSKKAYESHGKIYVGPGGTGDVSLQDFAGLSFLFSSTFGSTTSMTTSVFFFGADISLSQFKDFGQPMKVALNIAKSSKAIGLIQGIVKGYAFGYGVSAQVGWTSVR